jgi:hypothetical protein
VAGKSDAYEYDFLRMTFAGKPITNISATGGTTLIWMALCTADPGEAGSTAAEGGYAAYTRVSVDRSTGGWTVTSGTSAAVASASPTTALNFPQVATTSTGTFAFAVAYPSSNSIASAALYYGPVSPVINFSQNVTPQLTTGSSVTEE